MTSQLQQNPNIIIVRDDEHASQEYSPTMVRIAMLNYAIHHDSHKTI